MTTHQPALDGMPPRLYQCTPTRLTTWLDCPRRYRFGYLDRPAPPKGPPWAHNSMGVSVHNALRAWWSLPRDRRTSRGAGDLVVAGWLEEGFRDAAQSARWRDLARGMVESYVADLDPDDEPRGVERTVATRTAVLAISGRVDRIDERAGGLVVVDYKTGRWVPSTTDARGSLALALYVLGVRRTLHGECRRVELHHLPSGTVAAFDHTEDSLGRHLARAESLAAEAKAADAAHAAGLDTDSRDAVFPPRVGALCGWCDFARHCPQGRAAAPARRPWDGLDEAAGSPEQP